MVTEFVPDREFYGRCFHCRRVGATGSYTVRVGGNRQDHGCDCPGGCYGRGLGCVHVLALQAVIGNGWYPDPLDESPATRFPTGDEIDSMARSYGAADGDPFRG